MDVVNGTVHTEVATDVNANEAGPSTVVSVTHQYKRMNMDEDRPRASSVPLSDQGPRPNVGYVYHVEMMAHRPQTEHPEQPDRILRIFEIIREAQLFKRMKRLTIRPAKRDEVLLVHSEDHWDKVQAISLMTEQDITDSAAYYDGLSLYVHPRTPWSAALSCGGVIECCLAVARNEVKKTFAIVRPPGHHAEPDEAMGFCFFNNVSVAIRVVQQLTRLKKILVLDWDVHHGNGTQRAFYDDPSVLYISLHRYEAGRFYPCGPAGSMESSGEGAGLGYSVNIPWPEKGMGDADYIHAFQTVVMPIAMEFAPEMVIISAGFDAADGDELGECHVTPAGYAHMTHMLSGLAGGKLVVALEGGYNLDSISRSALAVAQTIVGDELPALPPLVASESATETVFQVARHQSQFWKSVNPRAAEPKEEMEPVAFSIPELLKAHRQDYLAKTFSMLQIPLLHDHLEERLGTQVMCTTDIMENETMVVFVHEFGNLRVELEGVTTCNVHLEHSYLVDCSKQLMAWIKGEGYSMLDVNVYPKPYASTEKSDKRRVPEDLNRDIMTYLWDNYIQLSDAQKVVFIGHGPGCQAVMELLHTRPVGTMRQVAAVIQVVGHMKIPLTPKDATDVRTWYAKHSLVTVCSNHPDLGSEGKVLKRHGTVAAIDEPKPIKLMIRALPMIREFVQLRLRSSPLGNTTGTVNNKGTLLSGPSNS